MHYKIIKRIETENSLLTVKITKNFILTGGRDKKLKKYNFNDDSSIILATHDKSIRSVLAKDVFIVCVSYDGKGTVFKNDKIFDLIEGPETEIKSVSISEDNRYLALATRGKTVWVLNIKENGLDIDAVLEDHLQDVKGVKFYEGNLYSYGYDNTIKVYEQVDYNSNGWDLIDDIKKNESTVWDLVFNDFMMISCDNEGKLHFFEFSDSWIFKKEFKASKYQIYSMCILGNEHLAYIYNLSSIAIINFECKMVCLIENLHFGEINCIDYCSENKLLVSVGDDGVINLINIKFS
ncbi:Cytosolic iron-sulfur protein assembly protein [Gurleya vavrai]